MATQFETNIRFAKAEFVGAANQFSEDSLIGSIVRTMGAPKGYEKITDAYLVGSFEDANGTPTVNGIHDLPGYFLETKARRYTGEIQYEDLRTGDAETNGKITQIAMSAALGVKDDLEKRVTDLVVANGTDRIYGGTLFSTSKTLPVAGTSIINEAVVANSVTTAAGIRAACQKVRQLVAKLRNGMNARMKSTITGVTKPALKMWYHPDLVGIVDDALRPSVLNDAARIDYVQDQANPYLPNATKLYFFLNEAVFAPFIVLEKGAPEMRVAGMAPGTAGDDLQLILSNSGLWQPYYNAEVGELSPFSRFLIHE